MENGLYAAAAGAIIYALVLHLAPHLDGSQLVARGGGRRGGPAHRPRRRRGGPAGGRDRARHRGAVPARGRAPDGLDRPVPVEGGRDRVPGGRRHRRRHRRAAQAHRDVRRWHQRVAGARLVGPRPGRHSSGRRCWSAASRSPSSSGLRFTLPKVPGALVLVVGGLVASVALDLGQHGVALVGPVPRGLPLPQIPSLDLVAAEPSRDHHLGASRCCSSASRRRPAMPGHSRPAIGIAST